MGEAGMVRLRFKEEQESRGTGDRRRDNIQSVLDLPLKSAFLLISFSPALLLDSPAANSNLAVVEAVDQAGEHAGNLFQLRLELGMQWGRDEAPALRDLQQRHAFLSRTAGDRKEVLSVRLGESAISLGQICGNRQRRPVELVDEEVVTTGELLRLRSHTVSEIDGLLIDLQVFEHECHERIRHGSIAVQKRRGEQGNRRPQERQHSGSVGSAAEVCFSPDLLFPCSPALFAFGESGRLDSNQRPLGPEPSALPG